MDKNLLHLMIKDIDQYYAHIIENENKEVIKVELLEEHVERTCNYFKKIWDEKQVMEVSDRILNRIYESPSENMRLFFKDMIWGIPFFHDYGKINPSFQKNQMKNKKFYDDNREIGEIASRHSFLSSLAYLEYFREALGNSQVDRAEKPVLRYFMVLNSYIISRHHSNLSDMKTYKEQLINGNIDAILEYLKSISNWEEIQLTDKKLRSLCEKGYDKVSDGFTREQCIAGYIYTKLMFSLLVASDYYATSEFMNDVQLSDFGNSSKLEEWRAIYEDTDLMKGIRNYQKNNYPQDISMFQNEKNINVLRTEILCDTEQILENNIDQHIFYLEAPTGSGKSNTAINLTFRLAEKDNKIGKIFYIYPFNTLVEQNINVLKKIFGNNKEIFDNIAVINSLTPIKADEKKKGNEDRKELGSFYQKALLDRQFLNYPMILSTHVTLFDTIFGDTKESAFGFHQLCNSIIILDEIQSYKYSIWGEIICFLKEMAGLMNIKLIIMSATLPNLDYLSEEMCPAVRLLKNSRKYFEHPCFKNRVEVSYELMNIENIEDSLYEHAKKQVLEGKKVLIEFIKKTTAGSFFRRLKDDESIKEYVEYMSGDDSVIERKRILESIDEADQAVILVATQVVEAGVDIDMDVGYKNISKLDSEEQFLGRINRSFKKENCTVYFFELDDAKNIYGKNEARTNQENTLQNKAMRDILINKDFESYYHKIMSTLKANICENESIGLEEFFDNQVKTLLFGKITERMKLIEDDNWSMSVYFARDIQTPDGDEISGAQVWQEYKELLNDFAMDYSEKKIKLSRITSKMSYFIYQIKKNSDLTYNDRIGEIFYIEDGEEFFEDGKLNVEKFTDEVCFI